MTEPRVSAERLAEINAERPHLVIQDDEFQRLAMDLTDARIRGAALEQRIAALERDYGTLRQAVNESFDDCNEECTRLGHREDCKTYDGAAMLVQMTEKRDAARAQAAMLREAALRMDVQPDHSAVCTLSEPCAWCDMKRALAATTDASAWLAEQIERARSPILDALEDALNQGCLTSADDGIVDSCALSAYADGLRLLAEHGRFAITAEYGRRVLGYFRRAKAAHDAKGAGE